MSAVHPLDRKSLASVLVALSIASLIILSSAGRTSAAPTGANFDHIVNIAMENRDYANVLGDGTPSGCPRGPDHSPCLQYADTANSLSCVTLSGALIGNSQVLGSTSNYVWITPTDNHNMHDNTVSSGDSWLKSFLVGSGSIMNPGSGSLFSSGLFTNPSFHTLLWIWWDEYDPSPNIQYGTMISKGFISTSNNWDEYSQLRMIENNWGLPTLSHDAQAPIMTDILGTGGPQALSPSFLYIGLIAVAAISISVFLVKYHSRNRRLSAMLRTRKSIAH